ncbi:MAG: hypothetical protein GY804_13020 [Alphaproteobacteria bacterium]|nr:hypothetical protein [Alphaproteobacteria bacterium]
MKTKKIFTLIAIATVSILFTTTDCFAAGKDHRTKSSIWIGKEKKEAATIQSIRESAKPVRIKEKQNAIPTSKTASKANNTFVQQPIARRPSPRPAPTPKATPKVKTAPAPKTKKRKEAAAEDNLFNLKSKKEGSSVFKLFGND